MEVFAFFGGLLLFGLIMILLPRLGFVVGLGFILSHFGFDLFNGFAPAFDNMVSVALVIGGIIAFIFDIVTGLILKDELF